MMVIPEDLPPQLAPIAWMLGSWRGWGMLAAADPGVTSDDPGADLVPDDPTAAGHASPTAADPADPSTADEDRGADRLVVEEVVADIVGTQMRMTTTILEADTGDGAEIDPVLDATEGLALLSAGDVLRQETLYLKVLPGSGRLPPPGEYEPRELMASGADLSGLATLWAGVGVGPRVQLVSDAIARDSQAEPVQNLTRMYGMVAGELMWTQERTLAEGEPVIDLSGRLARTAFARTASGREVDGTPGTGAEVPGATGADAGGLPLFDVSGAADITPLFPAPDEGDSRG